MDDSANCMKEQDVGVAKSCNRQSIILENRVFAGTCGVSENNRSRGFVPAFRDTNTGDIYLSRYSNGNVAPFHCLDGFQNSVVLGRTDSGHVTAVSLPIESGFVCEGLFYTREQAARTLSMDQLS